MNQTKLLVVDDDPLVLSSVENLLMFEEGLELMTVLGAAEGVRAWQMHKPNLTLLDLRMPEIDGLGALRAMGAAGDMERHPVIILSGHVTEEEIDDCRALGALDIWKKPLNMELLFAFLTGHLAGGSFKDGA